MIFLNYIEKKFSKGKNLFDMFKKVHQDLKLNNFERDFDRICQRWRICLIRNIQLSYFTVKTSDSYLDPNKNLYQVSLKEVQFSVQHQAKMSFYEGVKISFD